MSLVINIILARDNFPNQKVNADGSKGVKVTTAAAAAGAMRVSVIYFCSRICNL